MAVVILPDTVSRTLASAKSSQAPKAIPDTKQIISSLRVSNQPNTAYSSITLNLDIDHAAIGDLVVRLRSPQEKASAGLSSARAEFSLRMRQRLYLTRITR